MANKLHGARDIPRAIPPNFFRAIQRTVVWHTRRIWTTTWSIRQTRYVPVLDHCICATAHQPTSIRGERQTENATLDQQLFQQFARTSVPDTYDLWEGNSSLIRQVIRKLRTELKPPAATNWPSGLMATFLNNAPVLAIVLDDLSEISQIFTAPTSDAETIDLPSGENTTAERVPSV